MWLAGLIFLVGKQICLVQKYILEKPSLSMLVLHKYLFWQNSTYKIFSISLVYHLQEPTSFTAIAILVKSGPQKHWQLAIGILRQTARCQATLLPANRGWFVIVQLVTGKQCAEVFYCTGKQCPVDTPGIEWVHSNLECLTAHFDVALHHAELLDFLCSIHCT